MKVRLVPAVQMTSIGDGPTCRVWTGISDRGVEALFLVYRVRFLVPTGRTRLLDQVLGMSGLGAIEGPGFCIQIAPAGRTETPDGHVLWVWGGASNEGDPVEALVSHAGFRTMDETRRTKRDQDRMQRQLKKLA